MKLEGKFTIDAPIQSVWDFLLRPQTLASCIPGCEKVEAIDEKTYESIVKQKVGPISVRLKFTTTLVEMDPPKYVKAVSRGEDIGKAGTFTQESTISLAEISQVGVEVSYSTDANIAGRLATFGDRIMRAKAKSVEDEFVKNLREKLQGVGACSDLA